MNCKDSSRHGTGRDLDLDDSAREGVLDLDLHTRDCTGRHGNLNRLLHVLLLLLCLLHALLLLPLLLHFGRQQRVDHAVACRVDPDSIALPSPDKSTCTWPIGAPAEMCAPGKGWLREGAVRIALADRVGSAVAGQVGISSMF